MGELLDFLTPKLSWTGSRSFLLAILLVFYYCSLPELSEAKTECFCKLHESVDECACTVDSVDQFNNFKLFPLLETLLQRDFFKFYKVNMEKGCPFWPDSRECSSEACGIEQCDDQVPPALKTPLPNRSQDPRPCEDGNQFDPLDTHISTTDREQFHRWATFDENENKFCDVDEDTDPDMHYVDLKRNPERYTGYKGNSAQKVWRSIYLENCFKPDPKFDKNFLLHPTVTGLCLEKRVFYRLISGLHTSITVSIAAHSYKEQGIAVIANLLRNSHPPVVKTALGLVRNLATNDACAQDLHQVHAHIAALDALKTAVSEIENAHAQNKDSPVMEGVTMVEIVEMSACALQYLAKNQNMRADLIRNGAITFLVMALRYKVEGVLRPTAACLSELAQVPEAAAAIEREGAIPHLTELLNSGNEHLATYASGVLLKIHEGKPKEYQDRMNTHMSNVLCRDDSAPWTQDGLNEMHGMPGDESYNDMMQYGQATFDPSLSMEQMQLGGGGWAPPQHPPQQGAHPPNMYGVPPPPAPHMQQHPHQQGPPGWYDTDL